MRQNGHVTMPTYFKDFIIRFDGIFEISLVQWAIALSLVFASFIMRRLLAKGTIHLLMRLRTSLPFLTHRHLYTLFKPISFTIVILGFYAAGIVLSFQPRLANIYNQFLNSLIAFMFFWAIYSLIEPLATQTRKANFLQSKISSELHDLIFRIIRVLVVVVGLMTVLELWNINVFTFVAGLGLVGMAIAFAAQNTIKNLFGSMSLLMDQAFKKGDLIKAGDVEGVVESIGFRTTVLRQSDRSTVLLPNARIAEGPVINFASTPFRRIRYTFSIAGEAPPQKLKALQHAIQEWIAKHPEIDADPKSALASCVVYDLEYNTIKFLVNFFVETQSWPTVLRVRDESLHLIHQQVQALKLRLAEPPQATTTLP